MTTNNYYQQSANPVQGARGASSPIRSEYGSIQNGFDVLGNYMADVGTANALVVTPPTALTALFTGLTLKIQVLVSTTGATTLTVGTLGTIAVKYPDGTALVTNSLVAGQFAKFTYTGTVWQYEPNALLIAANGLPLTGGTMSGSINEFHGTDVVAAATVNLTTATGNYVHITGNTGITAITLGDGYARTTVFDSTPLLTHSATLFLANGGQNIQVAANDIAHWRGDVGGVTRLVAYTKANGQSVAPPIGSILAMYQNYGVY